MVTLKKLRIAVAGAGIYGTTIALKLAQAGARVVLHDPLGIVRAATAINQLRVHSGYHYPRSPETIQEVLEERDEFIKEFRDSIAGDVQSHYAIPHEGSLTKPDDFEMVCRKFSLPLKEVRPAWIDFDYIEKAYLVDEYIYDPDALRTSLERRINKAKIFFEKRSFLEKEKKDYDYVVYATYGTSGSHMFLYDNIQVQVAEKILVELPVELRKQSLVIIDGPFTAFDPYGKSDRFQFGSAKHTNHWSTFDPNEDIPKQYRFLLNIGEFTKIGFTHFEKMAADARKAVPLCSKAQYLGSRFTLRLVEYNPPEDRRILKISQSDPKTFHVFSGKVVSSVKAANIILEKIVKSERL